jgi:hypothetical protein
MDATGAWLTCVDKEALRQSQRHHEMAKDLTDAGYYQESF